MSVQSWFDCDAADVAELLAKEAVARELLKEADLATTLRDYGSQAMNYASDAGKRLGEFGANFGNKAQEYGNQALGWLNEPGSEGLRYGLAGAGVGGLLGAGSQLLKDPEDRQFGSTALSGALAGGALGGGVGMMRQHGAGLFGGTTPQGAPAAAGEPGSAGQPGAEAPPPSLEQQLEDVNKQISQRERAQSAKTEADYGRAARQGVGAAGAVLGTDEVLNNRPTVALQRGATAAELSNYGDDAQNALRQIRRSPGSMPLNRGLLSAYFDPQGPTWTTRGVDADPAVDLEQHLRETHGGGSRRTETTYRPPRLFAEPGAPNRYIPALTNDEIRQLNARQWPSRMAMGGAALAGLLPLGLAAAGHYGAQQDQQGLAQGLSGAAN